MFENRRYQIVIARAGRGRHARAFRRIFEFNLLIIGAFLFVGIGIVTLQHDAGQTATLKTPAQRNTHLRGDNAGAPIAVTATLLRGDGVMVRMAVLARATPLIAARQALRPSGTGVRWVRTPHPLAVPLPLADERPTYRIVHTSFDPVATGDLAETPPVPLIRLDTTTGKSSFWQVVAGLSLATFACGFWCSRKPRKRS